MHVIQVIEKRTGMPISLCIIYAAVAQRLGVRIEPVRYWVYHVLATVENVCFV